MIKPSDETYLPYHLDKIYDYNGPFQTAVPIAEHYGFRLVQPIVTSSTKSPSKITLDHKFNVLEHYLDNKEELSSPSLICHTFNAKKKNGYLNLDIYGAGDSFVETLLLKTAFEILSKETKKDLWIEINSFGSTESFNRFEGELSKFVKKNLHKFSDEHQDKIKENPFFLYQLQVDSIEEDDYRETIEDVLIHRPRPVAHLSEACRIHLKDLLEHLEETGMPYHLNPYLFPRSDKHAETVYTIADTESGDVLAYGERFSTQARTHAQKILADKDNEVDCAAITIQLSAGKAEKYTKAKKDMACKLYFAHSGAIAKRNTLRILEQLRDAKLECKHAVIKNSLREQLHHAERNQFPLTLILGVKEVQDGTIIIRNNLANRQKAVPQSRMCSYIKRQLKSLKNKA